MLMNATEDDYAKSHKVTPSILGWLNKAWIMRQKTWPTLIQILSFRLFGAKPSDAFQGYTAMRFDNTCVIVHHHIPEGSKALYYFATETQLWHGVISLRFLHLYLFNEIKLAQIRISSNNFQTNQ